MDVPRGGYFCRSDLEKSQQGLRIEIHFIDNLPHFHDECSESSRRQHKNHDLRRWTTHEFVSNLCLLWFAIMIPLRIYLLITVRYVGVIGFVLHLLLLTRFTQQNLCCISKSTMKHMPKQDWKSGLPWFAYGYETFVFVDFLAGYICRSSQLCSLPSVE